MLAHLKNIEKKNRKRQHFGVNLIPIFNFKICSEIQFTNFTVEKIEKKFLHFVIDETPGSVSNMVMV